jgi:hypothetical protein
MSFDASRVGPALPAIDDRLVAPDTRYEILEGRLVHVSPADPPHGTRHSKVSALLEAHTGLEFTVASDMLTRTSERSDVAPDVSVFPSARVPQRTHIGARETAIAIGPDQSRSRSARTCLARRGPSARQPAGARVLPGVRGPCSLRRR